MLRSLRFLAVLLSIGLAWAGPPTASSAEEREISPLHGLWKIVFGPMSISDVCKIERKQWFVQLAAVYDDQWIEVWHRYPSYELDGNTVRAEDPVVYTRDSFSSRKDPPNPGVLKKINELGLVYRLEGTVSSDSQEFLGNETVFCIYYDEKDVSGFLRLLVPVRATRVATDFYPVGADGERIDTVRAGEVFRIVLEVGEAIDWKAGWAAHYDQETQRSWWTKLSPDEDRTRYVSGDLTIAEPTDQNLDLKEEALAGRYYAEVGTEVLFYLNPDLAAFVLALEPASPE